MEVGEALDDLLDLRADVLARPRHGRDAEGGVERVGERARVGEAFERRAREAAQEHAHDRPRQRGLRRRFAEHGLCDLRGRASTERALPGDHLVGEHAEREHVGRRRGRLVRELFGGEVADPLRESWHVDGTRRQRRGQDAEVGDLDVTVGRDHDVGRREPEVRDAASMRVADGARRLRDQRERTTRGDHRARESELGDEAHRIETGDVLDRGERGAARHSELAHARDPWMLESTVRTRDRAQCLRLLPGRELAMELLDRELAFEPGDPVHLCARHHPTGAVSDRLQQLVAAHALRR